MSKQTLLTQGSKWVDLAQLGAAPATPAAGSNRLYVDANGLLQFASPAGSQPSRRVVTDWGVGTAFPATGLGRGDVYTHSGIGSMFLWNGAQWRQATPLTAGNLAILTTVGTTYGALLHDGVEAYVTGTKTPYLWDTATSTWVLSGTGGFPIAYLRQTAPQTGIPQYMQTLSFQAADIDTHGGYSTGTPTRWTVPANQGGIYAVEGFVTVNVPATGNQIGCAIIKNGAPFPTGQGNVWGIAAGAGAAGAYTGRKLLTLAAGDYVSLTGYYGGGTWSTYWDSALETYMAIERIR